MLQRTEKKTLLEQKYARSLIQTNMFMVSVPHFFGGGPRYLKQFFKGER